MSDKLILARDLAALLPESTQQTWVIDGGCHVGAFTCEAIEHFPATNVLAFEPDPESFEIAARNLSSMKQVELVEAALGRETGEAEFFRGPYSATNSLLPRPTGGAKPYYPQNAFLEGGCTVAVETLDHACETRGISAVAVLKLDLQGGELRALEGAATLLASGRVDTVIVEVVFVAKYQQQPLFWEIWQYLAQYGYSFYAVDDLKIGLYGNTQKNLRQGQWNQADAIFVSGAVRRALDSPG